MSSPLEDACVVSEEYGVFVSAGGDDESGEGTREKPFETLGRAIEEAVSSGRRVYACADAGSYAERVELGAEASGLELWGGFSCGEWRYGAERRSRVVSGGPLALRVEGVEGLVVEGFAFEAGNGEAPGRSSVGALVVGSSGVSLGRVRLEAGIGGDGEDGVVEGFVFGEQGELDGNNATGSNQELGGAEKVHVCPGGAETRGGKGGTAPLKAGADGAPDWGGGKGGAVMTCNPDAQRGGDAEAAELGSGAASLGELSGVGWEPGAGSRGANGAPGQGGGGGASSASRGGGGGGAGSCGGAGGPGGQGGGASIALAVLDSTVSLDEAVLVTADAGKGGNGALGQLGQAEAGFGGIPLGPGACQGGNGGLGAAGGAGGGGAGGVSIGILWKGGVAPVTVSSSIVVGGAGVRGSGGEPGVNDGVPGVAELVLELP